MRGRYPSKTAVIALLVTSGLAAGCALEGDAATGNARDETSASSSALAIPPINVVTPEMLMDPRPDFQRACDSRGIKIPSRYFVERGGKPCADIDARRGVWDGTRAFRNVSVGTCLYTWRPDEGAEDAPQDTAALAEVATTWADSAKLLHPNIRADCSRSRTRCDPTTGCARPRAQERKPSAVQIGIPQKPGCPLCGFVVNDTLLLVLPESYTDQELYLVIEDGKKQEGVIVQPTGEQVTAIPLQPLGIDVSNAATVKFPRDEGMYDVRWYF